MKKLFMLKVLILDFLPFFECSAQELELSSELINSTTPVSTSIPTSNLSKIEKSSVSTYSISSVITFFDTAFKSIISYISPNIFSTSTDIIESSRVGIASDLIKIAAQQKEASKEAVVELTLVNSAKLPLTESMPGLIVPVNRPSSSFLYLFDEFHKSNIKLTSSPLKIVNDLQALALINDPRELSAAPLNFRLEDNCSFYNQKYAQCSLDELRLKTYQTTSSFRGDALFMQSLIHPLRMQKFTDIEPAYFPLLNMFVLTSFYLNNAELFFERLTCLMNLREATNCWDDTPLFECILAGNVLFFPVETANGTKFATRGLFCREMLLDIDLSAWKAISKFKDSQSANEDVKNFVDAIYQNDMKLYELHVSKRTMYTATKYNEFFNPNQNLFTLNSKKKLDSLYLQLITENSFIKSNFSPSTIDLICKYKIKNGANQSMEQELVRLIKTDISSKFPKINDFELGWVAKEILFACKTYI